MIKILLIALLCGLIPFPAHAYLDPATGSIIFQFLIAFVVTAIATVKIWWVKFMNLIGKGDKDTTEDNDDGDDLESER